MSLLDDSQSRNVKVFLSFKSIATLSMASGGINGSSPWTLTTMSSKERFKILAASWTRSVPDV